MTDTLYITPWGSKVFHRQSDCGYLNYADHIEAVPESELEKGNGTRGYRPCSKCGYVVPVLD